MYNSEGDSPCEVANNLPYACGQFQIGPTLNNSPCICNSVTYSLAYACRICSGVPDDQITPFSDYASSYDCESTSVGSFPKPVPSGTVIPAWAYLPLTDEGKLDITKAQNAANEATYYPSLRLNAPGSDDASTPSVNPQSSQTSSKDTNTSLHTSTGSSTSTPTDVTPTAAGGHSQTHDHSSTSTNEPSDSTGHATSNTLQATGSDPHATDASSLSTVVSTTTQASTATITAAGPSGAIATPAPENPSSEQRISKAAVAGAIVAAIVLVASSTIVGLCMYRRWSRRQSHKAAREAERGKSQEVIRDIAQPSLEAISPHDLKFYDPDDPDTYPPPISEILPKAVHPQLSPNRSLAQA
ncbi:hypothetical protein C8Q73DRAFT_790712 [Cubamyces lactineus]|nr:hypothetical protein C8Q73DRAFT_790712 [Cubamyces lactineus]